MIIPILHNIRSLHNVGSILRTCDGLGIKEVWVSGYTPYPAIENDTRLPHIAQRATTQIAKTALGAHRTIRIVHFNTIEELAHRAKSLGIELIAVEQTSDSISLDKFDPPGSAGLVFGNEVEGLDPTTLKLCRQIVEIPMKGSKESFNISVAAGIILYTTTNQF